MFTYYAVDGNLPGGKAVRGLVACRGATQVVERGPRALCSGVWSDRPLTIRELASFARVEKARHPRLGSSTQSHLEHKFVHETDPVLLAKRGRFLEFAQEVNRRLKTEDR